MESLEKERLAIKGKARNTAAAGTQTKSQAQIGVAERVISVALGCLFIDPAGMFQPLQSPLVLVIARLHLYGLAGMFQSQHPISHSGIGKSR